jgi:P27 family predicted phage terminase small subunit
MPGPTRKPEAMAELDGNPGKRKYGDTPKPRAGAPTPPHWLKGEALAEWGRIVPELDAIGLLSVVDRAALTAYVTGWATFAEASEDIENRGTMVEGRDGNLVKNPSVAMQRDAMNLIKQWCAEFGLTPSARSRMQLPSEGGKGGESAEVTNLFAV